MTRLPGSAPASRTGSPRRQHRHLLAKGLLVLVAAASCFVALSAVAMASSGTGEGVAAAAPPTAHVASPSPTLAVTSSPVVTPTPSPVPSLVPTGDPSAPPSMTASPSADPTATVPVPTTKPAAVRAAIATGRNRLAIPALRIDAPIGVTTCGGLIPNGIWKWPCAGKNNLYLLGHAWGVFKPVHDGYHAGILTPGMVAIYTDGAGAVHSYRLLWIEDLPVATWGKGADWAATSAPVITLQTCDGATDAYRIIVRFVPA
jgi:hypothetical protein